MNGVSSVTNDNQKKLERRVAETAEAALAERRYVTAIDVLVGVGWLTPSAVDRWRQGRVEDLERVAQANLHKLSTAMATGTALSVVCRPRPPGLPRRWGRGADPPGQEGQRAVGRRGAIQPHTGPLRAPGSAG
jgi:hypothetical protein